jgi:hypothetical protein
MTPATDWKEQPAPGEDEQFERYAAELRDFAKHNAHGGPPARALHAKSQAGAIAEFTVLPDLPEHARVGLFAQPASYRAYVRFSNGSGKRQPDRKPDVRGVAVKLVGVGGKKLIPGMEQAKTQDFLAILTAATPFKDAHEFVGFVRAARNPLLLFPRVIGHFGFRRGLHLIRQLLKGLSVPIQSVALNHYYSAVAIRFGAYAVHYKLEPRATPDGDARAGAGADYLFDELAARLAHGPVEYDFRVQFYSDEVKTPIEDASREWDSPFITIGRLTIPQQQLKSERGRRIAEQIEAMSFDPWHAQEELRPLGNMMRARNHAYRLSTQQRHAAAEPDGTELLD